MIRLPDYIQDDAILTRLWGYSDQPEVTVNGRPVPVTDGTWESAFEDGDMLLADADSRVTLHNVRHGLVILAAGQSNMEWPVRDSLNEDEIRRRLEGKDISWLQVPRILYPGHDSGEDMQWRRLKPDAIGDVSAVGLLATLEVAERTGWPIALVGCYKGGSSASSWVPEEDLKADPALEAFYVTDYWADIADQTDEEEDARIAAFEQEVDDYNRRFADFDKAHPELSRAEKKDIMGHTPFPGPKGRKDFLRPAGLWDTMATCLKGLAPDILLWYQGEEDTKFAKGYKSLLTKLLARWRRELEQPDLPVVIAQLPGYMEYNPDKDWGTLRLAQMAVAEADSDAEIVCLLDAGDHENIHPQNKTIPGYRMGRMAAAMLGLEPYQDGPKVVRQTPDRVWFDQVLETGSDSLAWTGSHGLECDPVVRIRSATGIPAFPFKACDRIVTEDQEA